MNSNDFFQTGKTAAIFIFSLFRKHEQQANFKKLNFAAVFRMVSLLCHQKSELNTIENIEMVKKSAEKSTFENSAILQNI